MTQFKFDPHPGKFETVQDACTYAYIQLLRQRLPSMGRIGLGDESSCAYRGDHGAKCFVGHLWPDETYDRALENMAFGFNGMSISYIPGSALDLAGIRRRVLRAHIVATINEKVTGEMLEIIGRFQSAHDEAGPYKGQSWSDSFKAKCEPIFSKAGWPVPRLNLQPVL